MTQAQKDLLTYALTALKEVVAEHDAEPLDHEGPWFGRNDTAGTAMARDVLDKAEKVAL